MEVRLLNPELAEKARVELGEDPKKLQDSIEHLKVWIAKQPHLRARTDDQWLATFLRGSKFSLYTAKKKIEMHYTRRTIAADFFSLKYSDPKFMEILKKGIVLVLPKTEKPSDPRVILMRLGVLDAEKYTFEELMSVINTVDLIFWMDDDNYAVAGAVYIIDLKSLAMEHIKQMVFLFTQKKTEFGQGGSPIRMKGSYFLNMPPKLETLLNTIKNFMNEKIKNRFQVLGENFESLYERVSKDILPAEYGGNGGTIQEIIDNCVEKVQEYSAWLDEEENFGMDESKRSEKLKTACEIFGVEGSFRKLEVD